MGSALSVPLPPSGIAITCEEGPPHIETSERPVAGWGTLFSCADEPAGGPKTHFEPAYVYFPRPLWNTASAGPMATRRFKTTDLTIAGWVCRTDDAKMVTRLWYRVTNSVLSGYIARPAGAEFDDETFLALHSPMALRNYTGSMPPPKWILRRTFLKDMRPTAERLVFEPGRS